MSERTQKIVSIRRRTDQDLLVIVSRELDRGVTLVNLATTRNSQFVAQAEKAHGPAVVLLSKIGGLGQGGRLRIESSLKESRSQLNVVPTFGMERYPASVAS